MSSLKPAEGWRRKDVPLMLETCDFICSNLASYTAFKTLRSYIINRKDKESKSFSEAINSIRQAPAFHRSHRPTFLHSSLSCSAVSRMQGSRRIFSITFIDLERGAGTQILSYLLDQPVTSEPTQDVEREYLILIKGGRYGKADREK